MKFPQFHQNPTSNPDASTAPNNPILETGWEVDEKVGQLYEMSNPHKMEAGGRIEV